MALITATMLDLTSVTFEMIGRAYKCFDSAGVPFYMVESSRGLVDGEGKAVEYKVTWSKERGFRCTCPTGQRGFANCGAKKVCQHVLASVAAAKEEKEAIQAMNTPKAQPAKREHYLEVNGKEVSDAEYNRIVNSKGQNTTGRGSRSALTSNKGFSLMK